MAAQLELDFDRKRTVDELVPRKDLLRPDEVAEVLRCHRTTVYRLIEAGLLQATRSGRKDLRVFRASLVRHIERPSHDESA